MININLLKKTVTKRKRNAKTTSKETSRKRNAKTTSKETSRKRNANTTSSKNKRETNKGTNVFISFVKPIYGTSTKKIQINRNRSYTLKKNNIYYYHRNDTIVLSKRKHNKRK
jgi:hypothetical protein